MEYASAVFTLLVMYLHIYDIYVPCIYNTARDDESYIECKLVIRCIRSNK